MSQYEKATDEELAGLEARMKGDSYSPEVVEISGKGFEIRYNTATQMGELKSGATTMPLVEHQVKELAAAAEGTREQLAKMVLAGHQRTVETMRAQRQAQAARR